MGSEPDTGQESESTTDLKSASRQELERRWEVVDLLPAAELLRRDRFTLDVAEDEEVTLTPDDDRFVRGLARVRVESFDDLSILGLVPRGIGEERIREAIAADDMATHELAASRPDPGGSAGYGCGCCGETALGEDPASALTRADSSLGVRDVGDRLYRRLRTFHHPALAQVLSERYHTEIQRNDPLASVVHKWVTKFDTDRLRITPLFASIWQDITVRRGGRLTLDKGLSLMYARHLRIHRQGRLIQQGNYTKIWAASVESYFFDDQIANLAIVAEPWLTGP